MRCIGFTKKTIAALLCVLTLCVIFLLNTQLGSSPRHRTRYETRQTLSVPLTIDLSRNVTYINLPDANNEMHRYKLERVQEEDEGGEPNLESRSSPRELSSTYVYQERKLTLKDEGGEGNNDFNEEDDFGDRRENGVEETDRNREPVDTVGKPVEPQVARIYNVSTLSSSKSSSRTNYLLRVDDPRYPRMIAKILSKLPSDVRKEMMLNIQMVEAKSGVKFQKIHPKKQWEVVLKVFNANGYEQQFPDVINIGVKKSGTNAMGFFLPQHPAIVHSIGNEVHYFDWMYEKGLDYYKSRMGFSKPGQLTFEKTPRYFVTPEAPGRIQKDLPKTPKFILCVRDPIARLISDFRHESELKMRKEIKANRLKFSARSGEFEGFRLKQEILDSRGQVNASNELVHTSLYLKHYRKWLQYYPSTQIIVIDQDKMEKDVHREMLRLEEFLGLRPYFKPSMFYFDQERKGTCMRTSSLGPRNCPAKSTPSVLPKAVFDRETFQKVKDFYRPYNKAFAELTGLEFSWAN